MALREQWVTIILLVGATSVVCGCDSGAGEAITAHGTTARGNGGDVGAGGSGTGGIGTGGMGTGGVGSGGKATGASGTGGAGSGGRATEISGTGGAGSGGGATEISGTGGAAGGGAGSGGKSTGGTGAGGKGVGGTGALGTGGTGNTGTGGMGAGGAGTGGTVATGGVGAGGGGGSTGTPSAGCLEGILDYAKNGPFAYNTKTSGKVKMWIPKVPAGCKVPMVHLSNGTGATCSFYSAALVRLVSHGFLTLCYEDTNTGAGTFGLEAFKVALSQYPDLADLRFGSTGHSQGGMAAFNTLQYAESQWGDQAIYAGLAIEPASGFGENPAQGWETVYRKIKSPMFMFSGLGTDTLVSQSWVQQAFDALNDSTEAYFWAKSGANHLTTVNQDTNDVSISWFRWKLLADQKACQYFKAIPTTQSAWKVVDTQNAVQCK